MIPSQHLAENVNVHHYVDPGSQDILTTPCHLKACVNFPLIIISSIIFITILAWVEWLRLYFFSVYEKAEDRDLRVFLIYCIVLTLLALLITAVILKCTNAIPSWDITL